MESNDIFIKDFDTEEPVTEETKSRINSEIERNLEIATVLNKVRTLTAFSKYIELVVSPAISELDAKLRHETDLLEIRNIQGRIEAFETLIKLPELEAFYQKKVSGLTETLKKSNKGSSLTEE